MIKYKKDKDGNLELDDNKNPIVIPEKVTVNQPDDLTVVIKVMQECAQNLTKQGAAIGELKEFRDQAATELEKRLFSIDENVEKVQASIVVQNEETEATNKSVFDLVMNSKQESLT